MRLNSPLRKCTIALSVFLFAVAAGLASSSGSRAAPSPSDSRPSAFVPADLLADAQAHPDQVFAVILQGGASRNASAVANAVQSESRADPGQAVGLKRQLATVNGASAELTGKQLVKLARMPDVAAITRDVPVRLSGGISSNQQWPFVSGVAKGWANVTNGSLGPLPTIAVVDSGIDAARADFSGGSRVLTQVTQTSLMGNSPGDGYGHGTFVAGIAAGSASGYSGAAPSANLVSIDVMDDQGMALTSDVIAAADWIVQNKSAYNIRVANFSLHSTAPASVFWDPLDRAVEKLWFDGVVVVTASGNYGVNGQPSGVLFAPGNDPFVITVGADDNQGAVSMVKAIAAPWSAYGYTYDGFAKPDLAAPGRYMIGPVPPNSTLAITRASSVTAPGYMQLSGTSFAAPVISGAAAYLLALHPSWAPDQVKGALMLTAKPTPAAAPMSEGVGVVNAAAAALVTNPPNPNAALDQFVVADPSGGAVPVFDAASWGSAAQANTSWDTASWGSASWGSASWGSASWGSASWGSLAWSSASWGTASWGTASWGSSSLATASWGSASWGSLATADNAGDDAGITALLDPAAALEAGVELGVLVSPDGTVLTAGP
ncbi:MAG TPA: S8 family serine peptidase [Gaiellaceae bacterium]|nr:S8 family serine peptidase [Gaiellaceae bacterium]